MAQRAPTADDRVRRRSATLALPDPPTMDDVASIVSFLRGRLADASVDVAIVCGSGLSNLSSSIESPVSVPYCDIPGFPHASVAGHGSELVFGTLGGRRVVAQRGRFHFYEGHSMAATALPVRVFAALGARAIVMTNAAGGVNAAFRVGDIMIITDHVSLPSLSGAHALRRVATRARARLAPARPSERRRSLDPSPRSCARQRPERRALRPALPSAHERVLCGAGRRCGARGRGARPGRRAAPRRVLPRLWPNVRDAVGDRGHARAGRRRRGHVDRA